MLREMERSPVITVIGPHISSRYPGPQVDVKRMAVRVAADTAAEARALVRRYLPPDRSYSIGPALV